MRRDETRRRDFCHLQRGGGGDGPIAKDCTKQNKISRRPSVVLAKEGNNIQSVSEVAELEEEEEEEEEEVPFASHSVSQQVLLLLWRVNTSKLTPTLYSKALIIGVGRDTSAENIVNGDRRHMYTCVIVRLILVLVIYSKQTLSNFLVERFFIFFTGSSLLKPPLFSV